jgi:uncharacterized protein YjgD (DUF1641 family)
VEDLTLTWSASTDASGIILMFTEKKIIQVFFRLLDNQPLQHLMTLMLLMVMDAYKIRAIDNALISQHLVILEQFYSTVWWWSINDK